ncbi:MAG: GNAT family N-acetyltransferase, partial [Promethearchaeota archaeon]
MTSLKNLKILTLSSSSQFQARTLILEGLKDRFGWIDYSMNLDLDYILKNYNKPEQIFLTGWIGGLLVATGALIREIIHPNKKLKIARIVRMSVSRDYRRMGIAGEILKKLEEYARNFGYHQILLET